MIVAFLGPEKKELDGEVIERLVDEIAKLVVNEGAEIFLFTDTGDFDRECYDIVTALKVLYPQIQRVYVRAEFEDDDKRLKEIMKRYEHSFYHDIVRSSGVLAELTRREVMARSCDVLITYFSTNFVTPRIQSEEEVAAETVQKRKKRVINVYK